MRFATNDALDDLCRALETFDIDSPRLARYLEESKETTFNNLVGRSAELAVDSVIRDHSLSFWPGTYVEIPDGKETEHYRFSRNGHLEVYRRSDGKPLGSPDFLLIVDGLPVVIEVKTDRKLIRSTGKSHRTAVYNAVSEYFGQNPAYVLVRTDDDYNSLKDRKNADYLLRNGAKIVCIPFSRQEFRSYVESMVNEN